VAELTYWTARLYYKAIVADIPEESGGDADTDPETKGISGGVTITPLLRDAQNKVLDATAIKAPTLDPPALVALAPIEARLDDGQLKLTADQADVRLVAQTAVLDLPAGATLAYTFRPHHVTFNGGDQDLASFTVQAPTADSVVDVGMATHLTLI
jgi:hypothetical protein